MGLFLQDVHWDSLRNFCKRAALYEFTYINVYNECILNSSENHKNRVLLLSISALQEESVMLINQRLVQPKKACAAYGDFRLGWVDVALKGC